MNVIVHPGFSSGMVAGEGGGWFSLCCSCGEAASGSSWHLKAGQELQDPQWCPGSHIRFPAWCWWLPGPSILSLGLLGVFDRYTLQGRQSRDPERTGMLTADLMVGKNYPLTALTLPEQQHGLAALWLASLWCLSLELHSSCWAHSKICLLRLCPSI